EVMGRQIVHAGDSGSGQAIKIVNNMALAINTIATAEAFSLGENLGLSHQALYDVMSTSAAQSWSVTTNCPVPGPVPTSPASNEYRPGFATGLMTKDLTLAREAIEATDNPADFGMAAYHAYTEFNSEETSGKHFSSINVSIQYRQYVSTEIILTDTVACTGFIRLHRPDSLNALNAEVLQADVDAAADFQEDPNIMAILLPGN